MDKDKKGPENIDQYIAQFPEGTRKLLETIRAAIKEAAPHAEEAISYQMPTFKLQGNLVHFAGYKHHIGFYPAPSGIKEFEAELAQYQTSKGTVRFELDQPLPMALISKIVKYRAKANLDKAAAKKA